MALSFSLDTMSAKDTGVQVRAIAATSLALARVGGMAMEANTRNGEQGEFGHDRWFCGQLLVPALDVRLNSKLPHSE
jgi:hypothetical protein